MINENDVTIIIPHLGKTIEQGRALAECMQSLDEATPDVKKIVIVNGMDFTSDFDLFANVPNVSIMTMTEQGQCKAVNAAVATTNTPWVLITNDDMVYPPGWFEKLTKDITNEMCVSTKLVEPRPGAPTFLLEFCGGAGGDFDRDKFYRFVESWIPQETWKTGFNLPLLIKRELWDTVKGYDINYDPWGSNSDSDLEYKIKLAGVQPMQNQECLVYHFSQTSGTFEPKNDGFRYRNYAYFKEKWGFDRTDSGIWEADFMIPDEERLYRPEWEGKYGLR